MPNSINLLPNELRNGKTLTKNIQTFNRLIIALSFVFMFLVSLGFGYLYIQDQNLKRSLEQQELTKNSITNLQQTEQKLVLIKDRLEKAKTIIDDRNTYETLKLYDAFVRSLPSDASFTGAEVEGDIRKISITVASSASLAQILDLLEQSEGVYQKIAINNLTYSEFSGYNLTLNLQ